MYSTNNKVYQVTPISSRDHFNGHKLHSTCIGTHEMDSIVHHTIILEQCPGPDGVVPVAKVITITEREQRKK